ncbi:MAG TPA: cupredoxin domain-containing protein [Myxococcota bacterium]|nr:cupredoxin domain-containing protein [Myxococcota bacterium]
MHNFRLVVLGSLALVLGCSAPPPADAGGFRDDRDTIQVVSTNVQGKNVYIPSTIVVTAGKDQTLQIFNTTDVPHGFSIDGLGIQEVLPPQEEHEVKLSGLEGGQVFQIHCQLHPAHRTGTLVVLPAE